MNKFLEKYQKDQHYRNKIKLIIYISFIILVSIYALVINMNSSNTFPENIIIITLMKKIIKQIKNK